MIFSMEGILGKGKTISLVFMMLLYKVFGYQVASNVTLNHIGPYYHLQSPVDFYLYKDSRPSFFLFDEIVKFADSRESTSKVNKFSNEIAGISRKKDYIIGYSQQVHTMADKRLREITDYYCFLENNNDFITVTFIDREGVGKRWTFDGRYFFKYYDTNEVIEQSDRLFRAKKLENQLYYQSAKKVLDDNKDVFQNRSKEYLKGILLLEGFDRAIINNVVIEHFLNSVDQYLLNS